MALLISAADYYYDAIRARDTITDREQRASREELVTLRKQARDLLEQESAWQDRVVSARQIQSFQNDVIAVARECRCRVRKASTGRESHYIWTPGADLYDRFGRATNEQGRELPVTSQSLTITVVGSYQDVQAFLKKVEGFDKLLGIQTIRWSALGDGGVQLDADVLLFNLDNDNSRTRPRRSRA